MRSKPKTGEGRRWRDKLTGSRRESRSWGKVGQEERENCEGAEVWLATGSPSFWVT